MLQSRQWSVRKFLLFITAFPSFIFLIYITLSLPNYRNKPCTPILQITESHDESLCRDVMKGRPPAISFASQFTWCRRNDEMSEEGYMTVTKDCSQFRDEYGYSKHTVSQEEKDFPLAFSILMHENLEQTER